VSVVQSDNVGALADFEQGLRYLDQSPKQHHQYSTAMRLQNGQTAVKTFVDFTNKARLIRTTTFQYLWTDTSFKTRTALHGLPTS
jgi:hypothetical protein